MKMTNSPSLDSFRVWKSAMLLFVFVSLVVSTTFDPYHHEHDELMGYEFDDDGSLKEKTSTHNHNNDNVINHSDVIDDTTNHLESTIVGHYFDYTVFKNITVLVGETAQLRCRVKNIGNKTVSWVRHRDIHLLTVGKVAYTSDSRFQTIHDIDAEEWILRLRYTQIKDTGIYECQISSTPPRGYPVYLSVVEPLTTIVGGPEIFINTGSTINLTCIVKNSPESPFAMYWTHNNEEINYDSPRGGVSVITEKGDITTSYLLIQRARSSDSGQYTCSPSNANSKSVNVHILAGEHPEAMHSNTAVSISSRKYELQFFVQQLRAFIFIALMSKICRSIFT